MVRAGFPGRMGPRVKRPLPPVVLPGLFSWFPEKLYRSQSALWSNSYNVLNYRPTGGTAYHVSKTGSDSNDGKSLITPFFTISKALAQSDCGFIWLIEAGNWSNINANVPLTNLPRHVGMDCLSGIATICGCTFGVAWTASVSAPGAYEYATGGVKDVWDFKTLDANGDAVPLTAVASAAAVASTPGSYFVDTAGGKTYVRTLDGRVPDDDIHANLSASSFQIRNNNSASSTFWMRNVRFQGVQTIVFRVISATNWLTVYLDSCAFEYSKNTTAIVQFLGTDAYITNCTGKWGLKDFLNHHYSGRKARFLEWNNTGRDFGGDGAGNNNCFTCHDGTQGIRGNALGYRSEGPIFADVHGLTVTINVGCYGHDSTRATAGNNFTSGGGSGAEPPETGSDLGSVVYLLDCKSSGSATDTITAQQGVIRVFNSTPSTLLNNGGGGTVTYWNSVQECLAA